MSFMPKNNSELLDDYLVRTIEEEGEQPSKTYVLDFENKRIGGYIDDLAAVQQFVRKAIMTERSKWRIYSDAYGCELLGLIGQDVSDGYLHTEADRMVREALIYDDRIISVDDVKVNRIGDSLFIECGIVSIYGNVDVEVNA